MVDLGSKNAAFGSPSPPDGAFGSAGLTAPGGEFDSRDAAAAPDVLGALRARRGPPGYAVTEPDLAAGALSVTVNTDTTPVVVTLAGELDLATAAGLRSVLDDLVAVSPAGPHPMQAAVVIDLAALDFIDASGLAVLATARQSFRKKGGELAVRHPSPTLRKMLSITSLAGMVQEQPAFQEQVEEL